MSQPHPSTTHHLEAPGSLSPASRRRALERLRATTQEHPLDVLVIGGGVVGAGAALDATTRGLSTALVEATDYGWGTSSRSSKLVHGGLRYLEMLDFPLVHEALQERGRLIEVIAPHLVGAVPFLYPLTKAWERPYVGAGVALYDSLAVGRTGHLPLHKHLGRGAVARIAPGLKPDAFLGAVRYFDAQVDDARLVIELVRTSASHGAWCASRAEVTAYLGTGAGGRDGVTGVEVRDRETGELITVYARQVINATGAWTGRIPLRGPHGDDAPLTEGMPHVTAAKGIHVVVRRERFASEAGLILRTEKSVLFVIPWGRHWIVGTTDTPWQYGPDRPAATSEDIDYLLERVNTVLRAPLRREDIVGVYAGLRPLVTPSQSTQKDRPDDGHAPSAAAAPTTEDEGEGESESGDAEDRGEQPATATAKVSREHVVAHPLPGLTVVAGGKLTTYRVMAADAVDGAVGHRTAPGMGVLTGQEQSGAESGVPESCTAELPLHGAQGWTPTRHRRRALAAEHGLGLDTVDALLHRYGSEAPEVMALAAADDALRAGLPGLDGYLGAEVVHAVSREGARTVQDVLARRIRAVFEADDSGEAAAPRVARLMAPLLGWDDEREAAEVRRFQRYSQAQRRTLDAVTDAQAHRLLVEAAETSVRDVQRGGLPTEASSTPRRETT